MLCRRLGVGCALGLTRLMSNQLFGVTAHDPLTHRNLEKRSVVPGLSTFAGVAVLLLAVPLTACYVPAAGYTGGSDDRFALRVERG
jgi:hypothetical protein